MKSIKFLLLLPLFIGCATQEVSQDPQESNNKVKDTSLLDTKSQDPIEKISKAEPNRKVDVVNYQGISSLIQRKDWEQLELEAINQLQINQKDKKVLNALAMSYYFQKKPKAAKYFLNKILEQSPDDITTLNNLGLVSRQEQNIREAIVHWRRSIDLSRGQAQLATTNLVSEFTKARDFKKVAGAADRIDIRKVNNVGLLVNLGAGFLATDRVEMAERALRKALDLDSSNRIATLNLAILEIDYKKNVDQGRKHLDRLAFLGVQSDMQVTYDRLEKKLGDLSRSGGQP